MMSNPACPLLPIALALLLGACASTPAGSVRVAHSEDCPLRLDSGQTLILRLPSNPASGYRWHLQSVAPEVLDSLGPEVYSTPNSDVIGGDGVSTWRFQAARAGSGHLRLTYLRPWEVGAEPAGEFDCTVTVD